MKWQNATNQIIALIVLGLTTIFPSSATVSGEENTQMQKTEVTQIGMYDLLAHKEEIYNIALEKGEKHFIVSISDPQNQEFVFQGKLEVINNGDNQIKSLDFTPVYYHDPNPPRIIDAIADNTRNFDFILKELDVPHKQLILTQNGLMWLMEGLEE